RLQSITRGEGAVGQAWQAGEALLLHEKELHSAESRASPLTAFSALISPLSYRRKTLGVLALANGPMSMAFTEEDLNLFRSISEQSAFALYNEVVYNEASEKRKLDHDLEIAREIQAVLLPNTSPDIPGFEISGFNLPARRVSGDYYDYIPVDESHLGVAIADVSGKGVPASLIMTMCRSVIRSQAPHHFSPAEVLSRVNRQLYPDIREDMFISMAYILLNRNSSQVLMARAGHDAPLLYRAATKEVETLNPKGMALGIDSGSVFDRVCTDFRFTLERGDCLLLYTDGATEAVDSNGLEFGIPRLVQGLQASAPDGVRHVIERLSGDVKNFAGNNVQYDDVTLIAIRKL
ncbi:MAG TPA: GAF domain-containing SpoIIE family protein phosphatase, partial [Chthoniobacterales bacterium]